MKLITATPTGQGVKVKFRNTVAFFLAKNQEKNDNGEQPIKGRLATIQERKEKGLI